MQDTYQELGNVLKAYTQESAKPIKTPDEEAAQLAFGAYLSAAIENSELSREQLTAVTSLSKATLFALERGLIPAAEIQAHLLIKLAAALNEDVSTFQLLLGVRSTADRLVTMNSDRPTSPHLKAALGPRSSQPPIPVGQVKTGQEPSQHRFFGKIVYKLPTFAIGAVAAAVIMVLTLNPELVQRLIGLEQVNTGSASERTVNLESMPRVETGASVPTAAAIAAVAPTAVVVQGNNASITVASSASQSGSNSQPSAESLSGSRMVNENRPLATTGSEAAQASTSFMFRNEAVGIESALDSPFEINQVTEAALRNDISTIAGNSAYPAPVQAVQQSMPTAMSSTMPSAMTFYDYGINAFTETADDKLSTFGVDVDTGSYTIARRYINEGLLPPQEAIRVEEFVNYFDYGYPLPEQGDVFAIHMDTYPSPFAMQRISSTEAASVQLMRIGIQGHEVLEAERPDVALTFVIDVSGSMDDGGRLTLVKRALTLLVERLRPADSVGIVVYSTDARVVLQPTKASAKNIILDAIYALRTEDSTNVAAGLRLGYDLAWRGFDDQAINRVILASDGVANVGATEADAIWQQASQYADRGITLTTIGVGMGNYNDVIMEQMADNGDGVYGYVDTIEEAERLFVDELTGTLVTIAKDAKVQVEFNPEVVTRYRLLGYENRDVADADFRNDAVDAGEIGAGHSVTALYEVELAPEASGDLATVHLRWQDIDSNEVTEIKQSAVVNENEVTFEDAPVSFQLAAVVAEFAESLRNSFYIDNQMREQDVSPELQWWAYQVSQVLSDDEDVVELRELIERVERLVQR